MKIEENKISTYVYQNEERKVGRKKKRRKEKKYTKKFLFHSGINI
jgi:hypothetical protein